MNQQTDILIQKQIIKRQGMQLHITVHEKVGGGNACIVRWQRRHGKFQLKNHQERKICMNEMKRRTKIRLIDRIKENKRKK